MTDDEVRAFARAIQATHPTVKMAIFCALGAMRSGPQMEKRFRQLVQAFAKSRGLSAGFGNVLDAFERLMASK